LQQVLSDVAAGPRASRPSLASTYIVE
jgi:hypothetical protein